VTIVIAMLVEELAKPVRIVFACGIMIAKGSASLRVLAELDGI
jgi:hypothetical protein